MFWYFLHASVVLMALTAWARYAGLISEHAQDVIIMTTASSVGLVIAYKVKKNGKAGKDD